MLIFKMDYYLNQYAALNHLQRKIELSIYIMAIEQEELTDLAKAFLPDSKSATVKKIKSIIETTVTPLLNQEKETIKKIMTYYKDMSQLVNNFIDQDIELNIASRKADAKKLKLLFESINRMSSGTLSIAAVAQVKALMATPGIAPVAILAASMGWDQAPQWNDLFRGGFSAIIDLGYAINELRIHDKYTRYNNPDILQNEDEFKNKTEPFKFITKTDIELSNPFKKDISGIYNLSGQLTTFFRDTMGSDIASVIKGDTKFNSSDLFESNPDFYNKIPQMKDRSGENKTNSFLEADGSGFFKFNQSTYIEHENRILYYKKKYQQIVMQIKLITEALHNEIQQMFNKSGLDRVKKFDSFQKIEFDFKSMQLEELKNDFQLWITALNSNLKNDKTRIGYTTQIGEKIFDMISALLKIAPLHYGDLAKIIYDETKDNKKAWDEAFTGYFPEANANYHTKENYENRQKVFEGTFKNNPTSYGKYGYDNPDSNQQIKDKRLDTKANLNPNFSSGVKKPDPNQQESESEKEYLGDPYVMLDVLEDDALRKLYSFEARKDKKDGSAAYLYNSDFIMVKSTNDNPDSSDKNMTFGLKKEEDPLKTIDEGFFGYQYVDYDAISMVRKRLSRIAIVRSLFLMIELEYRKNIKNIIKEMYGTATSESIVEMLVDVTSTHNQTQNNILDSITTDISDHVESSNKELEGWINVGNEMAATSVVSAATQNVIALTTSPEASSTTSDRVKNILDKRSKIRNSVKGVSKTTINLIELYQLLVEEQQKIEALEIMAKSNTSDEDAESDDTTKKTEKEKIQETINNQSNKMGTQSKDAHANIQGSRRISSRGKVIVDKSVIAKEKLKTKQMYRRLGILTDLLGALSEQEAKAAAEAFESAGNSIAVKKNMSNILNQYEKIETATLEDAKKQQEEIAKKQNQFVQGIIKSVAEKVLSSGVNMLGKGWRILDKWLLKNVSPYKEATDWLRADDKETKLNNAQKYLKYDSKTQKKGTKETQGTKATLGDYEQAFRSAKKNKRIAQDLKHGFLSSPIQNESTIIIEHLIAKLLANNNNNFVDSSDDGSDSDSTAGDSSSFDPVPQTAELEQLVLMAQVNKEKLQINAELVKERIDFLKSKRETSWAFKLNQFIKDRNEEMRNERLKNETLKLTERFLDDMKAYKKGGPTGLHEFQKEQLEKLLNKHISDEEEDLLLRKYFTNYALFAPISASILPNSLSKKFRKIFTPKQTKIEKKISQLNHAIQNPDLAKKDPFFGGNIGYNKVTWGYFGLGAVGMAVGAAIGSAGLAVGAVGAVGALDKGYQKLYKGSRNYNNDSYLKYFFSLPTLLSSAGLLLASGVGVKGLDNSHIYGTFTDKLSSNSPKISKLISGAAKGALPGMALGLGAAALFGVPLTAATAAPFAVAALLVVSAGSAGYHYLNSDLRHKPQSHVFFDRNQQLNKNQELKIGNKTYSVVSDQKWIETENEESNYSQSKRTIKVNEGGKEREIIIDYTIGEGTEEGNNKEKIKQIKWDNTVDIPVIKFSRKEIKKDWSRFFDKFGKDRHRIYWQNRGILTTQAVAELKEKLNDVTGRPDVVDTLVQKITSSDKFDPSESDFKIKSNFFLDDLDKYLEELVKKLDEEVAPAVKNIIQTALLPIVLSNVQLPSLSFSSKDPVKSLVLNALVMSKAPQGNYYESTSQKLDQYSIKPAEQFRILKRQNDLLTEIAKNRDSIDIETLRSTKNWGELTSSEEKLMQHILNVEIHYNKYGDPDNLPPLSINEDDKELKKELEKLINFIKDNDIYATTDQRLFLNKKSFPFRYLPGDFKKESYQSYQFKELNPSLDRLITSSETEKEKPQIPIAPRTSPPTDPTPEDLVEDLESAAQNLDDSLQQISDEATSKENADDPLTEKEVELIKNLKEQNTKIETLLEEVNDLILQDSQERGDAAHMISPLVQLAATPAFETLRGKIWEILMKKDSTSLIEYINDSKAFQTLVDTLANPPISGPDSADFANNLKRFIKELADKNKVKNPKDLKNKLSRLKKEAMSQLIKKFNEMNPEPSDFGPEMETLIQKYKQYENGKDMIIETEDINLFLAAEDELQTKIQTLNNTKLNNTKLNTPDSTDKTKMIALEEMAGLVGIIKNSIIAENPDNEDVKGQLNKSTQKKVDSPKAENSNYNLNHITRQILNTLIKSPTPIRSRTALDSQLKSWLLALITELNNNQLKEAFDTKEVPDIIDEAIGVITGPSVTTNNDSSLKNLENAKLLYKSLLFKKGSEQVQVLLEGLAKNKK